MRRTQTQLIILNALKMPAEIYVILGAEMDPRIAKRLVFRDMKVHYLEWVKQDPSDDLSTYAKKIAPQIKGESPILIGFSFGGLLAMEIAKIISYEKIILVSCVQHSKQIPLWHRILGHSQILNWVPKSIFTKSVILRNYLMGLKGKSHPTVDDIHSQLPQGFFVWAMQAALLWKQNDWMKNVHHIHGEMDVIYPIKNFQLETNVNLIKKGGHMLFLYQARKVSELINSLIKTKNA